MHDLYTMKVGWIIILLLQILQFEPLNTINTTSLQTLILTKITRITKRSLPAVDVPDVLTVKEAGRIDLSQTMHLRSDGIRKNHTEITEAKDQQWVNNINSPKYKEFLKTSNQAKWTVLTNLDDKDATNASNKLGVGLSNVMQRSWRDYLTKYNYKYFKNDELKRRLEMLFITDALIDETKTHSNSLKLPLETLQNGSDQKE